MSEYLKECGKDLNITNNDLVEEYNTNILKMKKFHIIKHYQIIYKNIL